MPLFGRGGDLRHARISRVLSRGPLSLGESLRRLHALNRSHREQRLPSNIYRLPWELLEGFRVNAFELRRDGLPQTDDFLFGELGGRLLGESLYPAPASAPQ